MLSSSTTIDYTYDPLYRLTEADYSTNEYFYYTYDEVGNRLTQETQAGANEYTYDAADRLTEVDSVTYTWDDNGNLLDDGVREYTYDHANRLTQVDIGNDTYEFVYNGLGDRLRQIVNSTPTTYALDLNAGLTQVLDDGSNTYLYGLGRIGEEQSGGWHYHLGDALASVRQLTNAAGAVTLSRSYEPFGSLLSASGAASTTLGFASEWTDATELVHLRARYYDPATGRFLSRDPFPGLLAQPTSRHPYAYAYLNPLRFTDPSGRSPLAIVAGLGFLGGAALNAWMQYEANGGWCGFDLLEAFGWGIGGAATAVSSVLLGFQLLGWAGLGLQGLGMLANWPAAFGLGISVAGAAEVGLLWLVGANAISGSPSTAASETQATIHEHHNLPREFEEWFGAAGLDIEDYTVPLPAQYHTLKPMGVHTIQGGNWNAQWRAFKAANEDATQAEILAQLRIMISRVPEEIARMLGGD